MDPNVKKITRVVGRHWMLFGFGFLAVGLLILYVCLALPLPPPGCTTGDMVIFGGVLALLGAIFTCARFGAILDRQRLTVTTWWGLLVPFHSTEHRFSQTHHVTVAREERKFRNQSYDVFPVRLEGPGTDAITLHELRDHDKARRIAEDIAKFLGLGIRDRSSAEEITREAGALDQSLRQRMKRSGQSTPLPVQPPPAGVIFNYGGGRAPTTIELQPVGRIGREILLMTFLAAVSAIVVELLAWLKGGLALGIPTLFVFVFLVIGIFIPLLLHSAVLRERLVVSPDELIVTCRDVFGTKTIRLAGGEVEEVAITHALYPTVIGGGTSRIVIHSDHESIEFGAALAEEEGARWVADVLVHVLNSVPRDA